MTITNSSFDAHERQSLLIHQLKNAWRFNRLITLAVFLHLLLIPLIFIGMLVDPKIITGMNGWIKPLKFALSGAIYTATFGWLLTYVRTEGKWRRRLVQLVANVTGLALIIETLLITTQVVRNTTSHFNFSTPLDTAAFYTMGAFIMALSLMNLTALIMLAFQRLESPVFAWGVRFGLVATFVGMNVAFLMTAATPEQLATAEATGEMPTIGAHAVGVVDGGAGLPFLGWSTEGGDLRVPHFFGLHAIQLLPLLGFVLTLPGARRRWSETQRSALVMLGGVGYTLWIMLLTWQALRGQPVTAPDGATVAAYLLLLGAIGIATAATLWRPGRNASVTVSAK